MYRLTDDIARHRLLYPAPIVTVASVLVIDLPRENRGADLPLGRFYPIILENDAERIEVERFLAARRPSPVPPSLLDQRPSRLQTDQIVITRYEPPVRGWPLLSVCRWPAHDTGSATQEEMARGCYTMEMFDDPAALEEHHQNLLTSLSLRGPIVIRSIAGDSLAAAGRC